MRRICYGGHPIALQQLGGSRPPHGPPSRAPLTGPPHGEGGLKGFT